MGCIRVVIEVNGLQYLRFLTQEELSGVLWHCDPVKNPFLLTSSKPPSAAEIELDRVMIKKSQDMEGALSGGEERMWWASPLPRKQPCRRIVCNETFNLIKGCHAFIDAHWLCKSGQDAEVLLEKAATALAAQDAKIEHLNKRLKVLGATA